MRQRQPRGKRPLPFGNAMRRTSQRYALIYITEVVVVVVVAVVVAAAVAGVACKCVAVAAVASSNVDQLWLLDFVGFSNSVGPISWPHVAAWL